MAMRGLYDGMGVCSFVLNNHSLKGCWLPTDRFVWLNYSCLLCPMQTLTPSRRFASPFSPPTRPKQERIGGTPSPGRGLRPLHPRTGNRPGEAACVFLLNCVYFSQYSHR